MRRWGLIVLILLLVPRTSGQDQIAIRINYEAEDQFADLSFQMLQHISTGYNYKISRTESPDADIIISKQRYDYWSPQTYTRYIDTLSGTNYTGKYSEIQNWDEMVQLQTDHNTALSTNGSDAIPFLFSKDIYFGQSGFTSQYTFVENEILSDQMERDISMDPVLHDFRDEIHILDPLQLDTDLDFLQYGFNSLGYMENGRIISGIAVDWSYAIGTENERHSFVLRDHPAYADGSPIGDTDFEFSVELMQLRKTNSPRKWLYGLIQDISYTSSNHTLQLVTDLLNYEQRQNLIYLSPTPQYLNRTLTYEIGDQIIKSPVLGDVLSPFDSKEWSFYEKSINSTGLYRLGSYENNQYELTRNQDMPTDVYWIEPNAGHQLINESATMTDQLQIDMRRDREINEDDIHTHTTVELSSPYTYLYLNTSQISQNGEVYFLTSTTVDFDLLVSLRNMLIAAENSLQVFSDYDEVGIISTLYPYQQNNLGDMEKNIFHEITSDVDIETTLINNSVIATTIARLDYLPLIIPGMILPVFLRRKLTGRN